jgi:hypothetical protein
MRMKNFRDQIIRIRSDGRLVAAGFKWLEEKPLVDAPTGFLGDLFAPILMQTIKVIFTFDGSIQVSKHGRWDAFFVWRIFKWKMEPPMVEDGRSLTEIQSIGVAPIPNKGGGHWVKRGIPRYRVVLHFYDGGWRDVAFGIPGPDEARLISVQLTEALKAMQALVFEPNHQAT